MLTTLKLTIEYDGTRYQGFSSPKKTACIENKLLQTISESIGQSVRLFPAVKTEPGMHATCQIVSFQAESELLPSDLKELKKELNASLPSDIAICKIENAEDRFVASLAACSCTYTCKIATDAQNSLFCRPYTHLTLSALDQTAMQKAAMQLTGTYDFSAFSDGRTKKKTTRTVAIKITERNAVIQIQLTANGFLRHMPQLLAGTILSAGQGECKTDEIPLIFSGEKPAGPACPSYAFTLTDIQLR